MKFSRLEKIYQKYVLSDIKDMLDKRQKAGDRVGTFDKSFVLSIFDNMVFFSSPVEITGNKLINYKGPVFGIMFCKSDEYWQWKAVKPLFKDYCVILNFGWLIEDGRKEPSLFMFSPRVKRVKYE